MNSNEKKTVPEKEDEKKAEPTGSETSAEKSPTLDSEKNTEPKTEEKGIEPGNQNDGEPEKKDGDSDEGTAPEDNAPSAENDGENSNTKILFPSPSQPVTSDLQTQLLSAQAQLAAFKCGVRPDAVEDAVCLAINDAKKNGEVTAESIADALSGVLNRHPDWKNYYEPSTNFRIGADGMTKANASIDEISKIFGNKEE